MRPKKQFNDISVQWNVKVHILLEIKLKWYTHYNEVKNIEECNLLQGIINPPKRVKNINSHYSPILNGCMNTRKGRPKFKNFRIQLYSECISDIVMIRLVETKYSEKYAMMQWQTQVRNITTNF